MNDTLRAYSFFISDVTTINSLIKELHLYFRKSSMLREKLTTRKLLKLSEAPLLDEYDLSGRIFSNIGELRYESNQNGYKCLLVAKELNGLMMDLQIEAQFVTVNLNEEKQYYLTSIGALLGTYERNTVKLITQEYTFQDDIGGKGSFFVDYIS